MEAGSGPGHSLCNCEGSSFCCTEIVASDGPGAAVSGHTVTYVSESLCKWQRSKCWNNLMVNVSGM